MSIFVLDRVNHFRGGYTATAEKRKSTRTRDLPASTVSEPWKAGAGRRENYRACPRDWGRRLHESYFGAPGVLRSPPLDEFIIGLALLLFAGTLDPWPELGFPNSASKVSGSRVAVWSRPLSFWNRQSACFVWEPTTPSSEPL